MSLSPALAAQHAYSGAVFENEELTRTVECTRCPAKVGCPCIGPLGIALFPGHYARFELARELAR